MTVNGEDPVVDALRRLGATPPADLVDVVFSRWVTVPGPVGDLYVAFSDAGVSYIRTAESVGHDHAAFQEAFRRRFDRPLRRGVRPPVGLLPALQRKTVGREVAVDLRQLTDFERDVLAAARRIPAGQTRPYGWIAREIGRPRAVRAVGTALGNNPVPILIPCHRVTRAGGQLGEYVFGGTTKERLLRAEGTNLDEASALARQRIFYVGSATTHIVCYPTCAHARRITTPHRRGFRTVEAAASAGYRPCLACRPALAVPA